MKYDYLFVINPIAGGTDKTPIRQMIRLMAADYGRGYEIYETTGKQDEQAIADLLARDEPETVVAVGGDGTIQLLLPLLKYTSFALGVIPAGSANGMAAELDIPNDPEDALEVILEGNTLRMDVIRVNDRYDCLHIGDMGFNAQMIHQFEKENNRGLTGYALQFFRELKNPQPYQLEIWINGQAEPRQLTTYMIAFANAQKYGTGATLNPKGKLNDGLFELCVIKNISLRSFFDWLISVEDFNPEYIEIIPCRKASVKIQQPVWVQVDGEVIGQETEVEVHIQPKCLEVIVPEDFESD